MLLAFGALVADFYGMYSLLCILWYVSCSVGVCVCGGCLFGRACVAFLYWFCCKWSVSVSAAAYDSCCLLAAGDQAVLCICSACSVFLGDTSLHPVKESPADVLSCFISNCTLVLLSVCCLICNTQPGGT